MTTKTECGWNVAGWNNTQHAVELNDTLDGRRGSVETDRWYDLKVEVRGAAVKCWMDGRLIHELKNTLALTRGLFASATHEEASGDVIVKIVNASHSATETEVRLNGAKRLAGEARLLLLTSEKSTDENSLDEPLKVSPKAATLKLNGAKFTHTFPANSLTVLRVKSQP